MPNSSLADVQAANDDRSIKIQQAGIEELSIPINFVDIHGDSNSSIANFSAWASVPVGKRGVHMSRFVELAAAWKAEFKLKNIPKVLETLSELMDTNEVGFKLEFKMFLHRNSPISKKPSWLDYQVKVLASNKEKTLELVIPVTTLCPCSKEIANYGAHSQRSFLTVILNIDNNYDLDLNELAAEFENYASSKLNAVLKREDEKFVTEEAYDNARFAEDVIRDLATSLINNNKFKKWKIKISNIESIHNHNAFALTSSDDQE